MSAAEWLRSWLQFRPAAGQLQQYQLAVLELIEQTHTRRLNVRFHPRLPKEPRNMRNTYPCRICLPITYDGVPLSRHTVSAATLNLWLDERKTLRERQVGIHRDIVAPRVKRRRR